jgi:integrase
MRAYLDGIQSTVGTATLRERESKLLYLLEVMLELRLNPDPRTMDKKEIDTLVLWMRERNLGLAYQAKLWQYIRGLLAFVGNNILDVMKARGQWKPPKRAYRPVTVKDDGWFSATVARLANETGWRPRMVLAATAIYYHTGLRPKELRLAALKDLDLQRWMRLLGGRGLGRRVRLVQARIRILRCTRRTANLTSFWMRGCGEGSQETLRQAACQVSIGSKM